MSDKFISGIHNYCDRWCERCTFTSHCRVYEKTSNLTPEQEDINNKAFWENLTKNFKNTLELIQKEAIKHGIDLSKPLSIEEVRAYKIKEEEFEIETDKNPIFILCKKYQAITMPFLNESEGMVDKARELLDHLHLGIHSEKDVVYTLADIGDCFRIIEWYLFFFEVKLKRAFRFKIEGEEWEVENGYPKDSNGSAKIAIVAIEKSMAAWACLYNLLPTCQDKAIQVLSYLEQLKRKALQEFPEAMHFKRPGLDN
jgi:hypothetical protein